MTSWSLPATSTRNGWWATGMVLLAMASSAQAQPIPSSPGSGIPATPPAFVMESSSLQAEPASYPTSAEGVPINNEVIEDPNLAQTGCASCGDCAGSKINIPPAHELGPWGTGCCGKPCYPGRVPCDCCCNPAKTCCGRMLQGFYHCLCCPDPCYEGTWIPEADAAFFTPAARPKTQMRLRWENGFNYRFPDRAEYFWARTDGGKGPPNPERSTHYRQFSMYNEAAADAFSFFIEQPYRRVEPEFNARESGFTDLIIGTKSMLLDCHLLQVTFQFTTFIPTGQPGKGLGLGHVALEPSLLWTVRLAPVTYLQAQTAYWIPIGGDPDFQGEVFHYHFSLNHVIWCCGKDYKLVATGEYVGYSVLDGAFNNPFEPVLGRARTHMGSMGGGLRLFICDKFDIGCGALYAITAQHFENELYRAEFRWRF